MRVAQARTRATAARYLSVLQSADKESSGLKSKVATRPRVISSSQFSLPKMYRLRDTIIWRPSLKATKARRMVRMTGMAAARMMSKRTIAAMMKYSSQLVKNTCNSILYQMKFTPHRVEVALSGVFLLGVSFV